MTTRAMPDTAPSLPLRYPFPRGPLGTPPPVVHWARKHHPVCPVLLPSGTRAWMITRKDDIAEVLADDRFSRDLTFDGAPRIVGRDFTAVPGSLFNTDPPDHTRIRGVIAPYYTRAHTETYRPLVTELVTQALDALAAGPNPADLVEAFSAPLPPRIACAILRAPEDIREGFVANFAVQTDFVSDAATMAAATDRIAEFTRQVVAARREADPHGKDRDDPIGALITACDNGVVSDTELHGTASYLMVTGVESLVSPMATGPLTLLRHITQLRDCLRDPDLWPRAMEEVLRYYHNGVLGLPRVALQDVTLHGVTIRRGDAVCATMLGATWDPEHYRNPAKFNLHRPENANPTFGAGPHYCIGANQARMILTIAYQELFTRFPDLELAVPEHDVPFDEESMFTRPTSLPVTWSAETAESVDAIDTADQDVRR